MVRQCVICKAKTGCGLILKQVPEKNLVLRKFILNAIDRITLLHSKHVIYLCSNHYPQIQNPALKNPLPSSALSSPVSVVPRAIRPKSPSSVPTPSSPASLNTVSQVTSSSTALTNSRQSSPSCDATPLSMTVSPKSPIVVSSVQLQLQTAKQKIKKLQAINKQKNVVIHRLRRKTAEMESGYMAPTFEEQCRDNLEDPLLSVVLDHVKNKNKSSQSHRYSISVVRPKTMKLLRSMMIKQHNLSEQKHILKENLGS